MTRDEAVVLVSRALAIIQLVTAAIEVTYLPERILSVAHYARLGNGLSSTADYFLRLDVIELCGYLVRIPSLLLLALIFWNCGPWIARVLLPARKNVADIVTGIPE